MGALGVIPALLIAIAFLAISTFIQPFFNLVKCPIGILSHFARAQHILLPLINRNLPIYQAAAQRFGLPWELLAAIHYREHTLSTDPVPGGQMQFEPGTWQKYATDGNNDGRADINNFADSVFSAANYLSKLGAKSGDEESIKRSMLYYNRGTAWPGYGSNYDIHSYTMNNFDEAHKNMRWPSFDVPFLGGKQDTKDGAYTVYAFLVNALRGLGGTIVSVGDCVTSALEGDTGGLAPPAPSIED